MSPVFIGQCPPCHTIGHQAEPAVGADSACGPSSLLKLPHLMAAVASCCSSPLVCLTSLGLPFSSTNIILNTSGCLAMWMLFRKACCRASLTGRFQLLHLWVHYSFHAKATLTPSCCQPVTRNDEVLESGRSCAGQGSFHGQSLLWGLRAAHPRLSLNCAVTWVISYSILPPSFSLPTVTGLSRLSPPTPAPSSFSLVS